MARKRANSGLGLLLVGLVALYGCFRDTDHKPAVSPPPEPLQNPVAAAPPPDLTTKQAKTPPASAPISDQASPPPLALFSPTGESDPILPRSPSPEIFFVDANRLNLRAGPGIGHPVVATLTRGTRVAAYEERDGWRRITVSQTEGWAFARYLAVEPPLREEPRRTTVQKQPVPDRTAPTLVPRPSARSDSAIDTSTCCKVCRKGKPCGNSCIARDRRCRKGPGCACAAY